MKNTVLSMLEQSEDFVSGEYLSNVLGVSRTAVWKSIKKLREEGYEIKSVTNRGYMLVKKPDLLSAEEISDGLDVSFVGKQIEVLKTVDSTNNEIKRRAAAGAESGLLIAAERQTGGKGRIGRIWQSDEGKGVYFTFLLRPDMPPNEVAEITLAAGYGVCAAVREYTGLDARIKWPNDIVVGSRKLCGILTEMTAQIEKVEYVAVGIGINVNHKEFSEELKDKATSLYIETGHGINRNDFLRAVISELDKVAEQFLKGFTEEHRSKFKELCVTLNRKVTSVRGGKTIEGIAVDITDEGDLIVRDSSGSLININSGEVVVQGIY